MVVTLMKKKKKKKQLVLTRPQNQTSHLSFVSSIIYLLIPKTVKLNVCQLMIIMQQ